MTRIPHIPLNAHNIDTEAVILFPAMRWLIAETGADAVSAFAAASEMESDILAAYLAHEYSFTEGPFSLEIWMVENVLCF